MITPSDAMLFGQTDSHLVTLPCSTRLVPEAASALGELQKAAKRAGFDLKIASSFRGFAQQLAIFNGKFSGERPVLDENHQVVDITALAPWQRCQAILLYSALPGGSRHHWGSDFDYYDGNRINKDNPLALIDSEYAGSGPCASLYEWLKSHATHYDFFFPYLEFNGGIAREPWHLSYRPVADKFMAQLEQHKLAQLIESSDILAKDTLLAHLDEIYTRYIVNINQAR